MNRGGKFSRIVSVLLLPILLNAVPAEAVGVGFGPVKFDVPIIWAAIFGVFLFIGYLCKKLWNAYEHHVDEDKFVNMVTFDRRGFVTSA